DGSGLIYVGPNNLAEWTAKPGAEAWKLDGGRPTTEQAGASIQADLKLPARVVVEFELSWRKRPDFILALGVEADEKTWADALRFEVWGDDLVAVREVDRVADLAPVGKLPEGEGGVHLRVFLDQERGRAIVEGGDGRRIADLTVKPAKPEARPGVALVNVRGQVRLDRLTALRWDGASLPEVAADRPHVI